MSGGMAMYSDRVSNINKIHHLTDENGEMILQMNEMVLSPPTWESGLSIKNNSDIYPSAQYPYSSTEYHLIHL